jgi:hypothetical protein
MSCTRSLPLARAAEPRGWRCVMIDGLRKVTGRMLASPAGTPAKARFVGVDVARGIALISMLAANNFAVLNDNGTPTLAAMTVTGRSATLFVMVAGSAWLSSPVGGTRYKDALVEPPRWASPSGLC